MPSLSSQDLLNQQGHRPSCSRGGSTKAPKMLEMRSQVHNLVHLVNQLPTIYMKGK